MLKRYFVKQGIKEAEIENFIKQNFPYGDYSRTELQRTPLGTKIIIYTNKPGRIIGRSGKNINDITEAIRQRFKMENAQIDVKTIRNPNLDAKIVAKQIASALERGYNHRKIGNLTLNRIMAAGAIGAEIIISGKLGGSKGMTSKFLAGYLQHSGKPAEELVDYGFEEANTKPGKIGVKVKIMREFMDITGEVRQSMPLPKPKAEPVIEKLVEKLPEEEKPEEADILPAEPAKNEANEEAAGQAGDAPAAAAEAKKLKKPQTK
jgi:small subunit ribosomal protein S3